MATLEEVIRQRLAEATKQVDEAKVVVDLKKPEPEEVGVDTDVVDTKPKLKKELTKESLDEQIEPKLNLKVGDRVNIRSGNKHIDSGKVLKTSDGEHTVEFDNKMGTDGYGNERKLQHEFSSRGISSVSHKLRISKELTKESLDEMSQEEFDTLVEDMNKMMRKNNESTVSSQVSALLEAEGLSEEFKTQAVTIFEAAVADRVLQIEEGLKTEFDSQLAEAKAELDNDIDGFLSEAIQRWKQDNEVAIKTNFKSQVAESFIDGMKALIAEHNIEVPVGKEDALEVALGEVDKLNESIVERDADMQTLQEQVNAMKAEKILESFKEKMTQTEFDRFVQLTESVKFKDETQYAKQLTIVLENFGSTKKTEVKKTEVVLEALSEGTTTIVTESNSAMSVYANYLNNKR